MSPDGPPKPPPEERLLRLIRGRESRPQPSAAAQGAPAPAAAGPLAAAWPARVVESAQRARWTELAAALLIALLALEAAGILFWIVRPPPRVELPAPVAAGARSAPPPALFAGAPSLAASAPANMFLAVAPVQAAASGAQSVTTKQLAARLMLVGVVAGDPAQAIIEDTQTQRTYMVTPGQAVTEGAVLERVLDNRVVLDVGGEKIELAL